MRRFLLKPTVFLVFLLSIISITLGTFLLFDNSAPHHPLLSLAFAILLKVCFVYSFFVLCHNFNHIIEEV